MTDDDQKPTVALWYDGMYGEDYELFDTEADAADQAAFYQEGGSDHVYDVLGVQHADGRTVKAADWAALPGAVEEYRQRRARAAAAAANRPRPAYRKTRGPFIGRELAIEQTEPSWLGVQP